MLNGKLILPQTINNSFKGRKIALWLFYLITFITIARSLMHTFSADGGAQSIATIPLDIYPADAAKTIVLIFSLWGLAQFIMGIFYFIISIRYKSLIPLMYIFIFIEYTCRILLGHLKPIDTTGTAPGAIANYFLVPLSVLLFLTSINKKGK